LVIAQLLVLLQQTSELRGLFYNSQHLRVQQRHNIPSDVQKNFKNTNDAQELEPATSSRAVQDFSTAPRSLGKPWTLAGSHTRSLGSLPLPGTGPTPTGHKQPLTPPRNLHHIHTHPARKQSLSHPHTSQPLSQAR
jgi:hypothetical protein